tara:strand:+ start:3219 stop:3431 length:213 start_codon:yes stop_codon:yes gene_type:complete
MTGQFERVGTSPANSRGKRVGTTSSGNSRRLKTISPSFLKYIFSGIGKFKVKPPTLNQIASMRTKIGNFF